MAANYVCVLNAHFKSTFHRRSIVHCSCHSSKQQQRTSGKPPWKNLGQVPGAAFLHVIAACCWPTGRVEPQANHHGRP